MKGAGPSAAAADLGMDSLPMAGIATAPARGALLGGLAALAISAAILAFMEPAGGASAGEGPAEVLTAGPAAVAAAAAAVSAARREATLSVCVSTTLARSRVSAVFCGTSGSTADAGCAAASTTAGSGAGLGATAAAAAAGGLTATSGRATSSPICATAAASPGSSSRACSAAEIRGSPPRAADGCGSTCSAAAQDDAAASAAATEGEEADAEGEEADAALTTATCSFTACWKSAKSSERGAAAVGADEAVAAPDCSNRLAAGSAAPRGGVSAGAVAATLPASPLLPVPPTLLLSSIADAPTAAAATAAVALGAAAGALAPLRLSAGGALGAFAAADAGGGSCATGLAPWAASTAGADAGVLSLLNGLPLDASAAGPLRGEPPAGSGAPPLVAAGADWTPAAAAAAIIVAAAAAMPLLCTGTGIWGLPVAAGAAAPPPGLPAPAPDCAELAALL